MAELFDVVVESNVLDVVLEENEFDVSVDETVVAVITVGGPPGGQGLPGDGVPVIGEVVSGVIDGTNTEFVTASEYRPGSTAVYLNGLREQRGVGYVESDSTTITMDEPPLNGDLITIDYVVQ